MLKEYQIHPPCKDNDIGILNFPSWGTVIFCKKITRSQSFKTPLMLLFGSEKYINKFVECIWLMILTIISYFVYIDFARYCALVIALSWNLRYSQAISTNRFFANRKRRKLNNCDSADITVYLRMQKYISKCYLRFTWTLDDTIARWTINVETFKRHICQTQLWIFENDNNKTITKLVFAIKRWATVQERWKILKNRLAPFIKFHQISKIK